MAVGIGGTHLSTDPDQSVDWGEEDRDCGLPTGGGCEWEALGRAHFYTLIV